MIAAHNFVALIAARALHRGLACLVCAVLVLCGCAYMEEQRGSLDQSAADRIESGLQKLRGLNFTAPVPLILDTPDQAQQAMAAEIARDRTDEQIRIAGLTGAMIGLFPPGIDLKAETLKLLRSEIVAFYDPHKKHMVVVFGHSPNQFTDMILAHELTHALQDQHFQVDSMLNKVKNNDDQLLALKSVVEGEATLAGFGYVAGSLDNAGIARLVSNLDGLPHIFAAKSPGIPAGVGMPLMFQYSAGVGFVGEAYRRGGWGAVNAVYRNPPLSTQQIIHPALYFQHPTPPVHIELAGYQGVLKDCKKVDDDTYGEVLLRVIMEGSAPPPAPSPDDVLRQWAGDRMIVLQKDHALTLLWMVVFHDSGAARSFATSYTKILDHLRGEPNPHQLQVHANAVLIAIGPGAQQFAQLAPAIWQASVIGTAAAPRAMT